MAFAWHKIAETDTKQQLQDSWKFELYQWLASAPGSVVTLMLKTDYKLRRGTASAKNKFNFITNTTIDFQVNDIDKWLIDKLRSDDEYNFKGVILKNGSTFFAGYVSLKLRKHYYKRDNVVVGLSVYDGLQRLKEYKDYNELGSGLTALKDVMRGILNKLKFELNIYCYHSLVEGYDAGSYGKMLHLTYIKPEDYTAALGIGANYYDLLLVLAKQFDLNIFQENGRWVFRQNASIKHVINPLIQIIYEEVVNYSTGVVISEDKVDLDRAISNSDLRDKPITFEYPKIEKVEISHPAFKPEQLSLILSSDLELLDWVNPYFMQGSQGWTVVTGTPEWINDSVFVPYGGEIKQESGSLAVSQDVIIKLSGTCIRMILKNADRINNKVNNPMFVVAFNGSSNYYYWDFITASWTTTYSANNSLYCAVMFGHTIGSTWIEAYDMVTVEVDLDITTPAETGGIVIHCYGGAVASGNNYAYEVSAQHNFAIVKKKITNTSSFVTPNKVLVRAVTGDEKELYERSLPFCDLTPYSGVTMWAMEKDTIPPATNYIKAKSWVPDNKILMEAIAERIIKYSQKTKGYDLNFLPGKTLSFHELFECDLEIEGADTYYLPVFEQSELIKDYRKFKILQHDLESPSITTTNVCVFANE